MSKIDEIKARAEKDLMIGEVWAEETLFLCAEIERLEAENARLREVVDTAMSTFMTMANMFPIVNVVKFCDVAICELGKALKGGE